MTLELELESIDSSRARKLLLASNRFVFPQVEMKATLAPSGTGFLFQLLLALALASATLSQVQVQTVTSIANATSSSSVRPTFTLNSTLLPTSSPNATAIANSTLTSPGLANSTTNSAGPHLDTRVDATFGVLGGLLVVSGIPMGFWGAKNRWLVVGSRRAGNRRFEEPFRRADGLDQVVVLPGGNLRRLDDRWASHYPLWRRRECTRAV